MRYAVLALLILAPPAAAQPPLTRPLASIDATLSGQPIVAAPGRLRVTVSETTLAPGSRLPVHKHPFPRVVQVLSGRLLVTNLDTGKAHEAAAGDWLVDAVDQWHDAAVVGAEPVRLLTIDQAPPGAQVTIPRNP
jgi:quercetin dioxygenase-like cupin family protein